MIARPTPQQQPEYVPSPKQIRRACQEIQAGWDVREEKLRRGWSVTLPVELTATRPYGERAERE